MLNTLTRRSRFNLNSAIVYVRDTIEYVNRTLSCYMKVSNLAGKAADRALEEYFSETVEMH